MTTEMLNDLMDRQERLDDELLPFFEKDGRGFPMLRHPLVYSVPHHESMNALMNRMLHERKTLLKRMLEEKDFAGAIWLHERPYRLQKLSEYSRHMEDDEFWRELGNVITDSENLWQNLPLLKRMLRSKRKGRENIMEKEEREALSRMKDVLTVWRGCEDRNQKGISWTLDENKAKWFAQRFKRSNAKMHYVLKALVNKKDVIAYFMGRGESEVIVLPNNVKIVERFTA